VCRPENVIFVTGEPDSLGGYRPEFLDQFFYVVSGRNDLVHARQIRIQQGHPWFVEKSYDELIAMPPPRKDREICVISSNKDFSGGHRARLEFLKKLQEKFGDRIDVWGRGIRDFESKWDVLSQYKYAIVLENYSGDDFLTEKLPDALLAYCFPIYFGCKNWGRYLTENACIEIDLEDASGAVDEIERLLSDPSGYERRISDIGKARLNYLNGVQFFANLANILQVTMGMKGGGKTELIQLFPIGSFQSTPSVLNVDEGSNVAVDRKFGKNGLEKLKKIISQVRNKY